MSKPFVNALGPPGSCPFSPLFGWEGSTLLKQTTGKNGTLILSSLLDLVPVVC